MGGDRRWYLARQGDTHGALKEQFQVTLDAERDRLRKLARVVTLFEEERGTFGAAGLGVPRELAALPRNVMRSIVRTAHSRIIASRPRPFYCSDGGDFFQRQQLESLNEAVSGLFLATRFDQHASLAGLHGALGGAGAVKIYDRGKTVRVERVYPWEICVDPLDGYYGAPRTLYQVRWVDRPVLLSLYPRLEREIKSAPVDRVEWAGWAKGLGEPIRVVDGWHLPDEDGKHGRHVVSIDTWCLVDEPYNEPDFPIIVYPWADSAQGGYWPKGLGHELYGKQVEINRTVDSIREAIHRCAIPRIFIEESSKVPSAMMDNIIGAIVRHRGPPPTTITAQGVTADMRQYLMDQVASCFEDTGISQYAATSTKPGGIESGRALRIFADQQDGRLKDPSEKWSDFHVRCGGAMVRAMRRVVARHPDAVLTFTDPKKEITRTITWREIDLQDDRLQLICSPISSLPTTPGARAAMLDEMYSGGALTLEEYRDSIDLPDLKASVSGAQAPRRYVQKLLADIVKGREYVGPEPFLPPALCLQLGGEVYCQAGLDSAPEPVMAALRRWMVDSADLGKPPPGAPPANDTGAPDGAALPPDAQQLADAGVAAAPPEGIAA
jgi:hypothetical protein